MFEKEKKYFPKITDPQCQLKWNWSTLWLNEGTTNSCHRCKRIPLDPDNFDNFHNYDFKVKERKIMLQGKWPTEENGGSGHCNFCKKVEDVGGISDRIGMMNIPNQVPKELFKNPKATSVTPKVLEIFLNDTCNLKCTYCGSKESSQWESEIKKHGPIYDDTGKIMNQASYKVRDKPKDRHRMFFDKTLTWIQKYGNELSRLHLLGGETFYQSELKEVLDVLKKLKNPHLELSIVSNLMVKENLFKNYINQIKALCKDRKIGRFDLSASIDGWGPEAEYARTGLKCDHFEKLFSYAVNEKWMRINVNSTLTTMTIKALPLLFEKIKYYRKINKKIDIRFGFVTGKTHLHPRIYGSDFWKDDFNNIVEAMPKDTPMDNVIVRSFKGALKSITNNNPDLKTIKTFKFYLDQLDRRRNTNWRSVYPYLDI